MDRDDAAAVVHVHAREPQGLPHVDSAARPHVVRRTAWHSLRVASRGRRGSGSEKGRHEWRVERRALGLGAALERSHRLGRHYDDVVLHQDLGKLCRRERVVFGLESDGLEGGLVRFRKAHIVGYARRPLDEIHHGAGVIVVGAARVGHGVASALKELHERPAVKAKMIGDENQYLLPPCEAVDEVCTSKAHAAIDADGELLRHGGAEGGACVVLSSAHGLPCDRHAIVARVAQLFGIDPHLQVRLRPRDALDCDMEAGDINRGAGRKDPSEPDKRGLGQPLLLGRRERTAERVG